MRRLGSRCVQLSLLVSGDDDEDAYAVAVKSTAGADPTGAVDHHGHLDGTHDDAGDNHDGHDDDDDDATQSLLQYSHWDDVRPGGGRSYDQHCRSSVISRSASGLHDKLNNHLHQRRSVSFPATAKVATPDEVGDLDSAYDFL